MKKLGPAKKQVEEHFIWTCIKGIFAVPIVFMFLVTIGFILLFSLVISLFLFSAFLLFAFSVAIGTPILYVLLYPIKPIRYRLRQGRLF